MSIPVINCADVVDCSPTSWDLVFCICDPQDPPGICFTEGNGSVDTISALQGVYSTSAGSVSVFDGNTDGGGAAWVNPSNAASDNGLYASVTLDSAFTGSADLCQPGSQYIVLTDFGFSIPLTATIRAISVAFKGHEGGGGGFGNGEFGHFAVQVFNQTLTLNGTHYYYSDPNAFACEGDSPAPPYLSVQPALNAYVGKCSDDTPFGCDNTDDTVQPTPLYRGGTINCNGHYGPTLKELLSLTPLRMGWTPSNINDSTFGVGLSLATQGGLSSPVFTAYLDCVGVAIYYTASGGGGGGGNPSISPCPSVDVPEGDPYASQIRN